MALTDLLNNIGDAIRSKTGRTAKLTLAQMPDEIKSIETGGGDFVVWTGSKKFSAMATSGAQIFVSQTDLVANGIAASGKTIPGTWNNYIIMISADKTDFTHAQKQTCFLEARSCNDYVYSTSYLTRYYMRVTQYHNTATTSISTVNTYNPITTNTTGYLSNSTANGLFTTASTTYGIGAGTYNITVVCWGHK